MRQINITVYDLNELSEEAQERAHNDFIQYARSGFPWWDEWTKSLSAFSEKFGITTAYEIAPHSYSYCELRSMPAGFPEGIRLWKWLEDNGYFDEKFLGCTCPFTGYVGDETLLDPIRAFKANPSKYDDFEGLMNDCLAAWKDGVVEDMEQNESFENFQEMAKINGWEFTKDGKLAQST
jgi:hypothetical protein